MPFPLIPVIAAGATLGAAGLGAWSQNKATKEQKKQRKLAEKMAGCKGGTCSRKPSGQSAPQSNLQQQLSPQGAIPEVGGQGNAWTGYNASAQQLPRFTPEQQNALLSLQQQGMQNLNPDFLEQRAKKQFFQETIPTLAERFTSMGAGSQGSSDFRGALGAAGADLSSQLAALRAQVGSQQLGYGLQPQFENIYNPERQGILQSAASSLAPAATQLAGEFASPFLQKFGDWALGGGTQQWQAQATPQAPISGTSPGYVRQKFGDINPYNPMDYMKLNSANNYGVGQTNLGVNQGLNALGR